MAIISIPGGYMYRYIEVPDDEAEKYKTPAQPANYVGPPPKLNYTPENTEETCDNYFINNDTGEKTCLSGGGANAAGQQPERTQKSGVDLGAFGNYSFGGGGGGSSTPTYGSNTWTTGGGVGGSPHGGGGGMADLGNVGPGPGQVRTQFANLAPSVWNNAIPGSSGYAGQAGAYAGQAAGMTPNVAAPERTLYDKYSNLLQNPAAIANDPAYQFIAQQAQQASQRQLAAGRMSKSGNAAIQAAKVGAGTAGTYLRDLSSIYGAGAEAERARYGTEAGVGLEGYKAQTGAVLGAGDLAAKAGATENLNAQAALKARELDLNRVKEGIQDPAQQAQNAYNQQMLRYNNQYYSAGGVSAPVAGNWGMSMPTAPNLTNQYGYAPAFGF